MKWRLIDYGALPWKDAAAGVQYKPVVVGVLGASSVKLQAGAVVPAQEHLDEQLTWVLEGKLRLIVWDADGEHAVDVPAGAMFGLEPWVRHEVRALEDTLIFEAWSPSNRHAPNAEHVRQGA